VILKLSLVPGIVLHFRHIGSGTGWRLTVQGESYRPLLLYLGCAGWSVNLHRGAIQHRQPSLAGPNFQTDVLEFDERRLRVAKSQKEFIVFRALIVHIRNACQHLHSGGFGAGIAKHEPGDFEDGVGRKADRAAVLKFDLGKAIVTGPKAGSFRNRQVHERFLEPLAHGAVDLDIAFQFAQADNARLGVGDRRESDQQNRQDSQKESKQGAHLVWQEPQQPAWPLKSLAGNMGRKGTRKRYRSALVHTHLQSANHQCGCAVACPVFEPIIRLRKLCLPV
jgi:hypothetical protein